MAAGVQQRVGVPKGMHTHQRKNKSRHSLRKHDHVHTWQFYFLGKKKKKKDLCLVSAPKLFTFFFQREKLQNTLPHNKGKAVQTSVLHRLPLHLVTKHTCRQGQEPIERHLFPWRVSFLSFCYGAMMLVMHGFLDRRTWQRGPQQANGPNQPNTTLLSKHACTHVTPQKLASQTPGPEEGHRAPLANP